MKISTRRPSLFPLFALFLSAAAVADTPWPTVPGRVMPPFLRHIGIMPLGEAKFTKKLWSDYAKIVTTIVVPVEEVKDQPKNEPTAIHFFVDLGKWDFANNAKLTERVVALSAVGGRFAGWVVNGDVGSMVTNPRELEAFRKQLDNVKRDVPLFLACPYETGTTYEQCLPKSLEPFFTGVIWDIRFSKNFDAKCLGTALACREKLADFFAGMLPKFPDPKDRNAKILTWSLRVSASALSAVGDPVRLLKGLYAFFANEPRSVHFLLGIDGQNSGPLLKQAEPYTGILPLLTSLTTQQIQRNSDLGVDIENPLANDSRTVTAKSSKAIGTSANGIELTFEKPVLANRFVINFAAKNRPKTLALFANDGEADYYVGTWTLPSLGPNPGVVKLFTESFFFPKVAKLSFFPKEGKADTAYLSGWELQLIKK